MGIVEYIWGAAILVALVMILFNLLDIAVDLKSLRQTADSVDLKLYKIDDDLKYKITDLNNKLDDIAEELKWYKKDAFAQKVVDGLRRLDK